MNMRVDRCAECRAEIAYGEMMFPVYWSVAHRDGVSMNFICKECMQNAMREGIVPGGRI